MVEKNFKRLEILIENLGPVILGVKPSVLLNIEIEKLNEIKQFININTSLETIEVRKLKKYSSIQMFFYHEKCLEETLTQKVNLDFLKSQGYPKVFSLDKYLEVLVSKLKSENFPHEIGVFLGYPLKDVLGFMNIYPLKLIKIKGWRYYGSEKLSEIQYNKYLKAKKEFKEMIKTQKLQLKI